MSKRKKRYILLAAIFVLLTAALVFAFIDSNKRLVSEEYELFYDSLPAGLDGFRIVQLSDLHGAEYGEDNSKLLSAVSAARPDIIAVTGDLADSEVPREYVRSLMTALTVLAPVYFVTGNHEWACGWTDELFDILEECGVAVLRNEYISLIKGGDRLIIAGVDDPNGPADMKTPEELAAELHEAEGEDAFTVLLAHRNGGLERYSRLGFELILSGHAHGGIIRLPFTDGLVGPDFDLLPTYTNGVYSMNGSNIVVSRGLGNHSGLIRLFNNPDIPVVILRAG